MFHRRLFTCISSNAAEASFTEKPTAPPNTTATSTNPKCSRTTSYTHPGGEPTTFLLSKLKKKFNSSNERLSHHLKSKLRSKTSKKQCPPKLTKAKAAAHHTMSMCSVDFNATAVMSSTVCHATSFSGFYSENSDVSDDESDMSFDESDMSFEQTLKHVSLRHSHNNNNNSDIDSSFSSVESLDMSGFEVSFVSVIENSLYAGNGQVRFNPLVSSSRCDTSVRSTGCCSDHKRGKRRSLATFLPVQTSSRVVLSQEPDLSKILSESTCSSYELDRITAACHDNNVFSSTLITSV